MSSHKASEFIQDLEENIIPTLVGIFSNSDKWYHLKNEHGQIVPYVIRSYGLSIHSLPSALNEIIIKITLDSPEEIVHYLNAVETADFVHRVWVGRCYIGLAVMVKPMSIYIVNKVKSDRSRYDPENYTHTPITVIKNENPLKE